MPSTIVVQSCIIGLLSIILTAHLSGHLHIPVGIRHREVSRKECHPFLPNIFDETPPSADHPLIRHAAENLEAYLEVRFGRGDIDSLSVAVVTSSGPIFEQDWGTTRANETGGPKTTSHSSYRIASVTKLFPVLEGLVLEQKGALSW